LPNLSAGRANAGAAERSLGGVTALRLSPSRAAVSDDAARYFS
jgi:hypothetical protein